MLKLGYAEVAIFSRHFKQWTGVTPRQWRKAQGVEKEY
ncbi:MAG: AraC family transcriptional regulator [Pseudomonadales bacterium]|nr:AraC family transcriptional regulator [Pseudomonadales bacterium]